MLNDYTINCPTSSTSNHKNMSSTNENNSENQVKTINDLKRVIPKVKIFGTKVKTLQKLTQLDSDNKLNTMGDESRIGHHYSKNRLSSYCRTCAGLKIPLVDIFSDKGMQMRLNQQMQHLESINEYDSLSTQMCMDCICDLKMSYKFFMQIKKAEVKLKSIHASMNAVANVRPVENQRLTQLEHNLTNFRETNRTWDVSTDLNQQRISSAGLTHTNLESTYSGSDGMLTRSTNESVIYDKNVRNNTNDGTESIEEFDPDDHTFDSIESTNSIEVVGIGIDIGQNVPYKQYAENNNITVNCSNGAKNSVINDNILIDNVEDTKSNAYNVNIDSCTRINHNETLYESCPDTFTKIPEGDYNRETIKQPNILKRKASWPGKLPGTSSVPDLKATEAKIHKLNTVNISPSDEEGIMYVTVKGSKPNELLLVKVKKMDKCSEKKGEKNPLKMNDVKFIEKSSRILSSREIFGDRSKKYENREALIEQQIEQYKKKREKVLGGGTGANTDTTNHATDDISTVVAVNTNETFELAPSTLHFTNLRDSTFNDSSLKTFMSTDGNSMNYQAHQNEKIQVEDESHMDDNNQNDGLENEIEHSSNHEDTKGYLAQLKDIKQKCEEVEMKKERLHKNLNVSYIEGNLEKLCRILGERGKNVEQFQEYLKQRKIVITRLKDEDIISLYRKCNVVKMHNKSPDYMDAIPTLNSIGNGGFLDCDYCPQLFPSRGTLEEHLKSHDYKICYFCEDCGNEFPNNKSRRVHNISCLKKLICRYCDFMLESRGKKRQHEQKHCDTIYGQLCDVCGEKFKHQGTLDQHIKTQHMSWEKVFQCPKCPKKFAFKQKLSFHLKSVHTTLRAYLCEDCGADFKNPASLRHHRIRKHHPTSNKRECPVCHKLVPFYSLSKHMYTHKAYTIECPHCEKMFKNTSTLKQHVRIHEDQRQYRCDTCGVGFNRRDGLRLHMKVHQKSDSRALKECSCQICSEKFPNHSMLVIHRNRVHKDGRQYTCHICNRSMLSTRSLEWHMSHIHNETPTGMGQDESEMAIEMKRVSCNHCDKTFKTEMILRTHIKNTHMEKNPVKCLDCDLMFTSEVRMRHHMMTIHNRLEGTLTCPHCPKRFVNQLRLKTHMISHSEDRPYTCEICGFNLKTKIQLIKHHQNRHSDERPLQCRYCPWRCKQVSALVCHERTHTNERPYSCSECKQRFKYLGDKNKHERRHESLGGSGFKRIVAGRNVKQQRNRDGGISASENDPLDHDFETHDDQLNKRAHYGEEQQIVKFGAEKIDRGVQESLSKHKQEFQQYRQRDIDGEDDDEDEEEDEEEEEDDDGDDDEPEDYEDEEEEGGQPEIEMGQKQRNNSGTVVDDVVYKQLYHHQYETVSRETSEAAEVIMSMEDATVYTEEVTADNIENVEMMTAEIIDNQILQPGTVVHIQQQYDDGKIQVIPVMLTLPDLTDSTTGMNLDSGSIMYNS